MENPLPSEPVVLKKRGRPALHNEPVTLSVPTAVLRRARVLAALRDVTLSSLVTELLQREVDRQLPSLLADLQSE
jgi:hypothetical protein